jgi:hypothetical protein
VRARLEFLAIAGAALLFVVLAPVFWYSVESPEDTLTAAMAPPVGALDAALSAESYVAAQLAQGAVPLWSPNLLLGAPFHAYPVHAAFSPARLLDLALDPAAALAAQAFVHVLLAALCMLLLLRSLELPWSGILPGAAAYAFSGTMAGAMSLPGVGAAYAIGPLLFWGAYLAITRGERGGVWLPGMAMGLCMLSGSVDKTLAVWLLTVFWGGLLCPFLRGAPRWRRWAIWSAGTFFVGLSIAAIQLVPALVWSTRFAQPWEHFVSPAVPGGAPGGAVALLIHLLQPVAAPVPPLGFLGAGGVLLLLPALAGRRHRVETYAFALLFVLLTACTALDAVRDLPLLNADLFLFLLPLPGACLVGIGAARVLAVGKDPRLREVWLPALVWLGGWLGLMAIAGAQARGWLIASAAVLLFPMLLRWRWLANLAGLLLALLLFVELGTVSNDYYGHPFLNGRDANPALSPVLSRAGTLALDGRVLLLGDDATQLAVEAERVGIRTLGGERSERPRALDGWLQASGGLRDMAAGIAAIEKNAALLACLRALDVRAIITKETELGQGGVTALRAVETHAPHVLYALDSPGRVHWTPRWESVGDASAALARLTSPDFDPSQWSLLERGGWFGALPPLPGGAPASGEALTGGATWRVEVDTPSRMEVAVNTPVPGVLVVADQLGIGWSVALNEQRVPIYRANRLFRGVLLPEGEHRVVFTYRPWPLYAGALVSTLALGGVILAMLLEILRKRPAL